MPELWREISAADKSYCDHFVQLMQLMDPRYRALKSAQLQEWLSGTKGPYIGDAMAAFCWFRRTEDGDYPARMQIALLSRYQKQADAAELLMLGWVPSSHDVAPAALDIAVDLILSKGVAWLGTLQAASPVKMVTALRPQSMGFAPAQRLHDRFRERAVMDPPSAGAYIRLVHERVLSDASEWTFQVIR